VPTRNRKSKDRMSKGSEVNVRRGF